LFNKRSNECITYRHNSNENSPAGNYTWDVLLDKSNVLWVGTFGNGLIKMDPHKNVFHKLKLPSSYPSLSDNGIIFFIDSLKRIWITNNDGGFCVYSTSTTNFFKSYYLHINLKNE
jgi:streptogramin lyase